MPKIVDHHQRRKQLAEATWRVILKKGLEGVTVRNVAKEAGFSFSLIRHYFQTHSDLLAFSMQLVADRVAERLKALPAPKNNLRKHVETMIAELLPLDKERTAEAQIWFAFINRALTDENLYPLSQKVHQSLATLFLKMVTLLQDSGMISASIHVETEARKMHALVDGLVVHYVIHPHNMSKTEMFRLVQSYLDHLMDSSSTYR
jgi:DNA-binding transcriptional regulator YbjK